MPQAGARSKGYGFQFLDLRLLYHFATVAGEHLF